MPGMMCEYFPMLGHSSQYIGYTDCVLTFHKNVPFIYHAVKKPVSKSGFSSSGKNLIVPYVTGEQ